MSKYCVAIHPSRALSTAPYEKACKRIVRTLRFLCVVKPSEGT